MFLTNCFIALNMLEKTMKDSIKNYPQKKNSAFNRLALLDDNLRQALKQYLKINLG